MRRSLLVALAFVACDPLPQADDPSVLEPPPERVACYDAAEVRAENFRKSLCPGDWYTCPARGLIIQKLEQDLEACP